MPAPTNCSLCVCPLPAEAPLNVCAACAMDAAMSAPEVLPDIPGCEIEALAGEGGMGRVYRARQLEAGGRTVAVKVLKPGSLTPRAAGRFEREVALLSRLNHPHVAAVFGAGRAADGSRYLMMEWINGGPVTDWWQSTGAGPAAVAQCMVKICEGVQAAHAINVAHRDLKPSNILCSSDGKVLKVVDFGLAREVNEARELSITGTVVGTIGYMALEQGQGQPAGPPADVFSLGVLLFLGLTGRQPFPADSFYQNLQAQERGEMAGFGDRPPPRDLQAIVRKSLETDPSRRYRNAGEMAEDLQHFLAGRPVNAQQQGSFYRARKYVSRHKTGVAVAAAIILAAVASGAWHLWNREQAARELRAQFADTLLVSAELASQRGQLDEALQFITRAEAAGARHPGRLAVARLMTLDAMGRRGEASTVLEQAAAVIAADPEMPRGTSGYWRAHYCEGMDQSEVAAELLRTSLTAGLPPAETLVARALLTEDEGEAAELLARAAVEFPFHHQVLPLHALALSMTGRQQEGRQVIEAAARLFPKSENLAAHALLIAASTGSDAPVGRAKVDEAGREEIAAIASVMGTLPNIYELLNNTKPAGRNALNILGGFMRGLPQTRRESTRSLPSLAARFVVQFRRRELALVALLNNPFTSMDRVRRELAAELERKSPSTFIVTVLCASACRLAGDAGKVEDLRHEIEAACAKASGLPRATDPERAALLEIAAAMALSTANIEQDPAAVRHALDYTRQRTLITSVPIAAMPAAMLAWGAVHFEDWTQARILAERFYELQPDHPEARLRMAQLSAHGGEWMRCLSFLKDTPPGSHRDSAESIAALLEKARAEVTKAAAGTAR